MKTLKTKCDFREEACDFCEEAYKQEDLYAVDRDKYICEACKDSEGVNYCERCEEDFTENYLSVHEVLTNSNNSDTQYWCDDCTDHASICHDCNTYVCDDVSRYCEDCDVTLCAPCWENSGEHYHDEDEDSESGEHYDTRKPDTSIPESVAGKLMPENLSCGFECEVINSDHVYMNDFIGGEFGIVGDGSLNSGGVEIVSPARKGKQFEAMAKTLAKELKRAGVKVDTSCGLHLHIGIPEQQRNDRILYRLYSMYNRIEPVIYAMLPDSRSTGTYCKPLKDKELPISIKNKLQKKGASFMPIWYGTERKPTVYNTALFVAVEDYLNNELDFTSLKNPIEIRYERYTNHGDKYIQGVRREDGKGIVLTTSEYEKNILLYTHFNYLSTVDHEGKSYIFIRHIDEDVEYSDNWVEGQQQANQLSQEKYHNSRYHGCNLHSIFYRGTLELRYHSGTTSAEKIINWGHIHTMIVNYCISDRFSFRNLARLDKAKNIKTKVAILRDLVGLNESVYTYILDRIKYFHSDLLEPKKRIKPVVVDMGAPVTSGHTLSWGINTTMGNADGTESIINSNNI